jgi:peptide/nickel transport system substrate-binding protein
MNDRKKFVQSRRSWLALFFPILPLFFAVTFAGPGCPDVHAGGLIKVGLVEEPKTLNTWRATDTWSGRILNMMYQQLYVREPKDLKLIPWLAEEMPLYDPGTLSYTVRIRPAKWSDGSDVTSEDVAFTGNLVKEFKIPRDYSEWEFVKKIEVVDKQTVRFFLSEPKAMFITKTLSNDIVQKKEWEKKVEEARKAEKPLAALFNYSVDKPASSGPFVVKEWKQGAYLFLAKNPNFFGSGKTIAGYPLGPYVDGIILKFFGTSDAAILALKMGEIDMFWWGIQPGYIPELEKEKNIQLYVGEKSGLYFLGFNLRKKPFDDVRFRQAVATLIDKDFILERVLQRYAEKMSSIVPPGNKLWYCPDVATYGEGLKREDRVRKAYEILSQAGYKWKVPPLSPDGKVGQGEGILLPDGSPMADFTVLTPPSDYDPHRAMAGMMVQEWLRAVGIPASAKPMAFGSLVEQVKSRRQFDTFVLGYGSLSLDPDYLRNFFHSSNDIPGGWNMAGYRNPQYDKLADESCCTMDEGKRREIIWEMQRILARDIPYIPLYNPKLVEGVRKDKFTGWVEMLGGVGNPWSFCTIKQK